jgi:hypothetical protein
MKRFSGSVAPEWFFQEVLGFHFITKIFLFKALLLYIFWCLSFVARSKILNSALLLATPIQPPF